MTSRAAAGRYARAVFDVARAERIDFERILRELHEFETVLRQHEALGRVLANPAIPPSRKRAVIEQLLARASFLPIVSRVLLLLAERARLAILPDLVHAYRLRLMDHLQVVRAEVTTAVPLPPDRAEALQRSLARATGRRVELDVRVDAAIVGGAVARIGSTVYDGSVTTQLDKMRERLGHAPVS